MPNSHTSGASFLGISWAGGARAPLLPQTPSPLQSASDSSVEALHELFEHLAPVLEVVEHVEGGARGRKQHDVARRGERARPIDGLLERPALRYRNRGGSERGTDLWRVLADEERVGHPSARSVGQRLPRLPLAFAARDEHDPLPNA